MLNPHICPKGADVRQTITPEILVRDELATDRLREIPVSGLRRLKYYAVTPNEPVRPQAAKFIEWLKQIFAA